TVTDVEIGVRSDWTIGTVGVRANASAFVGDYEDVQVALTGVQSTIAACNPASNDNPPAVSPDGDCDPNNDPAGGTLLVNIGESRVSGLDLELTVVPVENLSLDLGFSYLDTETRKYEAPPPAHPMGGMVGSPSTTPPTRPTSLAFAVACPCPGRWARSCCSTSSITAPTISTTPMRWCRPITSPICGWICAGSAAQGSISASSCATSRTRNTIPPPMPRAPLSA